MSDKQTNETEQNKVVRTRVIVLLDGTFVVRWQENRVQELQTGEYRVYHKRDFGAMISDYELNQLQRGGIIERFDETHVWLCPTPKHHDPHKTLWEKMRARSYYLNTTFPISREADVINALAEHGLQDDFLPRLRDEFVVLWGRNGLSFRKFEEAESARQLLLERVPDIFSETVVAFVETSKR
ncbi:MAG: hypothetical protein EA396_13295 [Anaerolineaceae bacterium]|nr:MAG: hypothetical protein EA396_13295 [Anaerolineaceae bacterium]